MTIARLQDRAVLRLTGADVQSFLQGLLTQDVALLCEAVPLYAGLLSPQGKALFDVMLYADGDAVLIDVVANRAEALAKRLTMYRMRKAVTIELTTLAVFAGWDGDAAGHAADPRFAALGSRWTGPPEGPDAAQAYEAHQRNVGVPDSVDIGEDQLLWLETGADLLNGVSFTKGCYVGQENTARMHHRDKVRRRLVPVRFEGDAGDGVVRDGVGRSAGTLRSHRAGAGFAHLRLDAVAGPLSLGEGALTVLRPAWLEPALVAAVADA